MSIYHCIAWEGEGRVAMHSLGDATVSSSNAVSLVPLRQDLPLNVKFALSAKPASFYPCLASAWVLGIQTQVFTLAQPAPLPTEPPLQHPSRSTGSFVSRLARNSSYGRALP